MQLEWFDGMRLANKLLKPGYRFSNHKTTRQDLENCAAENWVGKLFEGYPTNTRTGTPIEAEI